MPQSLDYFYFGIAFAVIMALIPSIYRTFNPAEVVTNNSSCHSALPNADMNLAIFEKVNVYLWSTLTFLFEDITW